MSSFCTSPGGLAGETGAGIPSATLIHEGGGWQGGLCTNPSSSQLRASKDDCQREKEEKEKLKKLLKQHKQVGMGGNPLWAEGLGAAGNGWW